MTEQQKNSTQASRNKMAENIVKFGRNTNTQTTVNSVTLLILSILIHCCTNTIIPIPKSTFMNCAIKREQSVAS